MAGEREAGLHGDGVGGEHPTEYGGGERIRWIASRSLYNGVREIGL